MGGILGGASDLLFGDQKREDRKAQDYLNKSIAGWDNISVPTLEDLTPEKMRYLGDLNLEGISGVPDVGYQDISDDNWNFETDPALREKQLSSLSALDDIAQNGGFTLSDRANLNRVQNEAAQGDRGRRDAMMQNMSARGMGGSGMELLANLQSNQAATDRTSQAGMDQAGMAQQRALEAIMNQGSMAGSMRGQDFGENAQRASNRDSIAKFNATNRLGNNQFNADKNINTQQFNAGAANQGKTASWGAQQDIQNQNTGITNNAEMYNKGQKPMAQYDMEAGKQAGKSGAYGQGQQYWQAAGDRDAAKGGAIIGAAGSIAGGAMAKSDERLKKDVDVLTSSEIKDFLEAVNPKKYKYKNPNTPTTAPGERAGFMLQDVQGTDLGDMLTEKQPDNSLAYDKDNLQGIMLAALSDLEKRKEDK